MDTAFSEIASQLRILAEELTIGQPTSAVRASVDRSIPRNTAQDNEKNTPIELVEILEKCLIKRERITFDPQKRQSVQAQIDAIADALMRRPRPQAGMRVAGAELIKPLASGNFATVWESRSLATGDTRATKILHAEKFSQGLMLWRFRRSIRAMQLLTSHRETPPSIVRIRDVADDTLAFTMDYLTGGDLSDVEKRGWGLRQKIDMMLEVCRAVAFAHRMGVIHRDIKPSNVVLDGRGRPVLTDFDIADIRFVTKLSVVSGGLGTPVFAAPEQLEDADKATEQSDIYSLGRLLYYLLLERSPGHQIENDPSLENIGNYPAALVAIVRRATQYREARRYPTLTDMIADMERYESRRARLRARVGVIWRWVTLNRYILMIFALTVIFAIGFGVYYRKQAELERRHVKELTALAVAQKLISGDLDVLQKQRDYLSKEIEDIIQKESSYDRQLKGTNLPDEERRDVQNKLQALKQEENKARVALDEIKSKEDRLQEQSNELTDKIKAMLMLAAPEPDSSGSASASEQSRPYTAPPKSCSSEGQTCDTNANCCGLMVCLSNKCAPCRSRGEACRGERRDCCGLLICLSNKCEPAATDQPDPVRSDPMLKRDCSSLGESCDARDRCCFIDHKCENGHCVGECRKQGAGCRKSSDCCSRSCVNDLCDR